MSLIHIRSKENDFEISYSENPINLSGLKGEIALKTASLWYSWDNITEEYKNNEIKFRRSPHERSEYKSGKNNEIKKDRDDDRNESEWKILKLPNGLYDENELNNYIQEYFGTFETPPFYFDVNYAVGDSKGAGFFPSLKHLGPTSHSGRVRIIGFFLGTCTLYINTLYIASFKNCCCNYRRELTNTFYNLIQHVLFIQSSKLI
jgi:hypothetical protein